MERGVGNALIDPCLTVPIERLNLLRDSGSPSHPRHRCRGEACFALELDSRSSLRYSHARESGSDLENLQEHRVERCSNSAQECFVGRSLPSSAHGVTRPLQRDYQSAHAGPLAIADCRYRALRRHPRRHQCYCRTRHRPCRTREERHSARFARPITATPLIARVNLGH